MSPIAPGYRRHHVIHYYNIAYVALSPTVARTSISSCHYNNNGTSACVRITIIILLLYVFVIIFYGRCINRMCKACTSVYCSRGESERRALGVTCAGRGCRCDIVTVRRSRVGAAQPLPSLCPPAVFAAAAAAAVVRVG